VSRDLEERSFSGEEGIKEVKSFTNSWVDDLEDSLGGIESVFFSFSGGVDVDEFSGFLF
jgi:hypothetical protein